MRLVFGLFSLLVAFVVVGVLAKKQLGAVAMPQKTALGSQAVAGPAESSGIKNSQLKSQQLQEQVSQSLETAMQRPRIVDGE